MIARSDITPSGEETVQVQYEKLVIRRLRQPQFRGRKIKLVYMGCKGQDKIYYSPVLRGYYRSYPIQSYFPEEGYTFSYIHKDCLEPYKPIIDSYQQGKRRKEMLSILYDLICKDVTSIIDSYDYVEPPKVIEEPKYLPWA